MASRGAGRIYNQLWWIGVGGGTLIFVALALASALGGGKTANPSRSRVIPFESTG
jgi:hypothetical protein